MARQHHAGCAAHGGAGQFLGGEAVGLPRSGCLSRQAKPPKLSLVAGRATAAMGGRRSRPPALGMTQRWMKSCGGRVDVPSCRPPRRCCQTALTYSPAKGPPVLVLTLSRTRSVARGGARAARTPPPSAREQCWSCAGGVGAAP